MLDADNIARIKEIRKLVDEENWEEALRLSNKVLDEKFDEPNAMYFAGLSLLNLNRLGLAQTLYRRLSQTSPDRQEVWNMLGRCYQEGHDIERGYKCFQRSLHMEPRNIPALNNMALIHINQCEPDEAIPLIDKALRLKPNPGQLNDALENMALACLMKQDWEQGWDLYEETMGSNIHRKERMYGDKGRWDGSHGKSVVTYSEQGLGDEIYFSSCIPDLVNVSKEVVVDCDPRLKGLFQRSFPKAKVYGTRYKNDNLWPNDYNFDHRASFSSLPKFFRRKTEDFPGTPYLIPDPERRIQWRALLDTLPGLKVGIAWHGGIPVTGKKRRSLPLIALKPILSLPCSFVSLEYRDMSSEIAKFEKDTGIHIHHWPRATEGNDYDDTAALVAELDLVISVTTAVIHLCGAIGKQCLVLCPPRPRWFYGLDGATTPWYKSVELYRHNGNWPIHRIAQRLKCLAS